MQSERSSYLQSYMGSLVDIQTALKSLRKSVKIEIKFYDQAKNFSVEIKYLLHTEGFLRFLSNQPGNHHSNIVLRGVMGARNWPPRVSTAVLFQNLFEKINYIKENI